MIVRQSGRRGHGEKCTDDGAWLCPASIVPMLRPNAPDWRCGGFAWPPDSSDKDARALQVSPTRSNGAIPVGLASASDWPGTRQRERRAAECRHVRVEIEGSDCHADALAQGVDVDLQVQEIGIIHHDATARWLLQPVAAVRQRTLARTLRADMEGHLPLTDREVDALEHFERPEPLPQAADFESRGPRGRGRSIPHHAPRDGPASAMTRSTGLNGVTKLPRGLM